MTVTIDGHGNTHVHPKEDLVGRTMIRMCMPIHDEDTAGALMHALSRVPGTHVVYREGKVLISLHRDYVPNSVLGTRTARVQVLIPQGR